jgi:hypothetical protein
VPQELLNFIKRNIILDKPGSECVAEAMEVELIM